MTKEHLIDFDRKDRIGIPETIFCQDKEINQIKNICNDLDKEKTTLLPDYQSISILNFLKKFKKY